MPRKYKSKIAAAVHEAMQDAYDIGLLDKKTMREFDESCLTTVGRFSPKQIKKIREREGVSQAVLARHLNVETKLVGEWERGEKEPSGPLAEAACARARPRALTPSPEAVRKTRRSSLRRAREEARGECDGRASRSEADQQAQDRRHPRRRHRQRGGAGGHPRAGGGGRPLRHRLRLGPPRLVVPALRQDRRHDAGRRAGADRQARCHLSGRRRLARRARPRLAVGPADPDPPRLPAVREPAPRAAVRGPEITARRPQARRHRLLHRAREQRGRVFLGRRALVRGHRARAGGPGGPVHQEGLRPGHALRLRSGHDAQAQGGGLGHQVERHLHLDALLGRALRRHRQGVPAGQDQPVPRRHPGRPPGAQPAPGST